MHGALQEDSLRVKHLGLSYRHWELLKVFKQGSDRVLQGRGWFQGEPGGRETNKKTVTTGQVRLMQSKLGHRRLKREDGLERKFYNRLGKRE